MEKRKKRLIILSVIAGVLVLTILLSSAIFKIKSVSIEYQTTLTLLSTEDLDKLIEDSDLPMGKSIFFSSMKKPIEEMEKKNPYVKINAIERRFPNSLVVFVSERVPVVKVQTNSGVYVLDNELKVLNIASSTAELNSITGENDLPVLNVSDDFNSKVSQLKEGEFVADEKIQGYVDAFYKGAVVPSKDDASVAISLISSINSITIGYEAELEKVKFSITYSQPGLTSEIIGDNNLVEDIYKVITTIASSEEYQEVNCTDGQVYVKKK